MENKKNISFKLIFTLFGIFGAGLTGLRIYQLFRLTEADSTGFFTRINPSVFVLYIGAFLSVAVLLCLVVLSSNVTASKSPRGRNKPLAIGAALFALGLGADVAISIAKVIIAAKDYSSQWRGDLLAYLASNGYVAIAFEAIFGLGACIYLILIALSYFEGKATFYEYKLLALFPLLWSMARIIRRFLTKISFTVVADLLLELVMLAFMMMFFISFARISSQICQKFEMRKAMSYGLIAALFAAVLSVSRLLVTVGARTELLPDGFAFSPADLGFAVFAVAYINACSKSGRDASEDEILSDDETVEEKDDFDEDFLSEE